MKGDQDMVDLLESRGATLAALTDAEKEKWETADGDGTLPLFDNVFISFEDEVDLDEGEDDEFQNYYEY
ncbi:uncharacterized protein N7518_009619 [Penicillium psychrosexuale]|uniref:uncharacterized protein n=1 Tax=Penicillium psychrosexuale TaxID=1002107 RepID=UPI00254565AE|nr:uncharacterized protein N7518_009619 [Penicillium psychrosexuale]KAJ5783942.1 hypothetical protein N7518_009619 [Penicillium psychrosexuale]